MYAWLFREHGKVVRQIRIVAILRDWDKNKALQGGNYPNAPIQIIPITLWSKEEQYNYILDRVHEHKDAEDKIDDFLPLCTACDTWEQPSKYAVMKEGRKTAVRVFDTQDEADCFIDQAQDSLLSLTVRAGKRTRCEDYCLVSKFCNQFKEYKESL